MSTDAVEVERTSAGNFALRGSEEEIELDPVSALGPESPRPLQITVLQKLIGLRLAEIAYASRVSEQTVRNWKRINSYDRPPHYDELRATAHQLLRSETISPRLIGAWFRSRNRGLGYERPLEAIRNDGFVQVMRVAAGLEALSPPPTGVPPGQASRGEDTLVSGPDLSEEAAALATESSPHSEKRGG